MSWVEVLLVWQLRFVDMVLIVEGTLAKHLRLMLSALHDSWISIKVLVLAGSLLAQIVLIFLLESLLLTHTLMHSWTRTNRHAIVLVWPLVVLLPPIAIARRDVVSAVVVTLHEVFGRGITSLLKLLGSTDRTMVLDVGAQSWWPEELWVAVAADVWPFVLMLLFVV